MDDFLAEEILAKLREVPKELYTCIECNEEFPEIEGRWLGLSFLCDDCCAELYTRCDRCGGLHLTDNLTYSEIEEAHYCVSCVRRYLHRCAHCRRLGRSISGITDRNDHYLCDHCYREYYYTCYECEAFIHMDNAYHTNGHMYCRRCYCPNEGIIHSWNYCPSPLNFLGNTKDSLYLGVELEIECFDDIDETAQELQDEFDPDQKTFYLKEDGSLDDGFEVVTHPATLPYHQKLGWAKITAWLRTEGCKSHDTTTCGLHIHVSRKALTESEQVKLVYFVNSQQPFFELMARRGANGYTRFKDIKLKRGANHSTDRYEAINFINDDTVEFRLWRGTLRYETLIATIELTHAIVKFVKIYGSVALTKRHKTFSAFIAFIRGQKEYRNLQAYLTHRGVA